MKTRILLFAAGALLSQGRTVEAELADGVEALVHDSVITFYEVAELAAAPTERALRDYPNETVRLQEELDRIHQEVLQELIERRLILHEFDTAGYSLPERLLDEIVQGEIQARFGDRATAIRTLAAQGETIADFRRHVRERYIVEALRTKNVSSEILISPVKVQTYYVAHPDEFRVQEEVHLRVIVLKADQDPAGPSTLQLATELRAELGAGVDFGQLACVYSQEARGKDGGEWGWWEKSRLAKVFADIAFALSKGQCSRVFSRSAGDDCWVCEYEDSNPHQVRHYAIEPNSKRQSLLEERHLGRGSDLHDFPPPEEFYLLQIEDFRPAHSKPLSEAHKGIEETLRREEQKRLHDQWIDRLKKKTFVKLY